jgi:hypothetical protein
MNNHHGKLFLLLLLLLLFVAGHTSLFGDPDNPIMINQSDGWWQKTTVLGPGSPGSKTLQTSDGGKHWHDVSPPSLKSIVAKYCLASMADFLPDVVFLCPLDAKCAWLSVVPLNLGKVRLEYTKDAGKHWEEKIASISDGESAPISFLDDNRGFLLSLGGPAAGTMEKHLYGTDDGGNHWHLLADSPVSGCYPTGVVFRTKGSAGSRQLIMVATARRSISPATEGKRGISSNFPYRATTRGDTRTLIRPFSPAFKNTVGTFLLSWFAMFRSRDIGPG